MDSSYLIADRFKFYSERTVPPEASLLTSIIAVFNTIFEVKNRFVPNIVCIRLLTWIYHAAVVQLT